MRFGVITEGKRQIAGDRLTKLRALVSLLDADVIGLQEIADRAALALLFPPADWDIFIDDESDDAQDLAIVVRHPFKIKAADLNAEDADFLFPDTVNEHLFPNRRERDNPA